MIDSTTVAIGTIASTAMGAGFNLWQAKKNAEFEKALKRQRTELLILEGVSVLSVITTFVETQIWKKKYLVKQASIDSKIDALEISTHALNDRLNGLNIENVVIGVNKTNSKLDSLIDTISASSVGGKESITEKE